MGGILSEPPGEARAAVLLLPGYGRPARSGTNSFWTRLARELAAHGLLVLRIDYAREGETIPIGEGGGPTGGGRGGQTKKRAFEMLLLGQVLEWFEQRLGGRELLIVGACTGGRAAIDLAADQSPISRTFLVVPHLRTLVDPGQESRDSGGLRSYSELDDPDAVAPTVVEHLETILGHAPSWLLAGEHDLLDVAQLERRLGPTPYELEVETVPGLALHFLDQPEVQEQARSRMLDRIARALTERESSLGGQRH
jgi:dienelactone hydrolase